MKNEINKELAEFESLVNEVKGECDKCKMDCRDRLRWMDSLVESLRHQLAKAVALNRMLLEAAEKVADIQYIDKELARLTGKILQKEVGRCPPEQTGETTYESDTLNRYKVN